LQNEIRKFENRNSKNSDLIFFGSFVNEFVPIAVVEDTIKKIGLFAVPVKTSIRKEMTCTWEPKLDNKWTNLCSEISYTSKTIDFQPKIVQIIAKSRNWISVGKSSVIVQHYMGTLWILVNCVKFLALKKNKKYH